MIRQPTGSNGEPTDSATSDRDSGLPPSAVRRAPFSDNPQVGARGQRTQQRILSAALTTFGEVGYHRCNVDTITEMAGCSRAAFYQYFASKEEVLDNLARQVIRQLSASMEMLPPIGADGSGREALRAWVGRYGDIFDHYRSVFQAAEETLAGVTDLPEIYQRAERGQIDGIRSRLPDVPLPRELDTVVEVLLRALPRTLGTATTLGAVHPDHYARDRVHDAVTDVIHRTFFGLMAGINTHEPAMAAAPTIAFSQPMREALASDGGRELNAAGRRTLASLVGAGQEALVTLGYHRCRIDDVVEAAGVSHGSFYRYFASKEEFAYALAVRALQDVSRALVAIPAAAHDPAKGRSALRAWLRRYNEAQSSEMAMIRVWGDAVALDPELAGDSAAALDWGRRNIARFLAPRGFGDVETEAIVMLSVLSTFSSEVQPTGAVSAATTVIRRGLLGR